MTLRSLLGGWAAPLLIHNQNQVTAMTRAAAAKAQGLDPALYGTPLPGSNVTTTTNHSGMGWLPATVLTLGSLLAGGVTASALMRTTPSPPANSVPAAKSWIGVYEQQQPDGTWKEVKRENLK
jgi:hypothetical protein